MTNASSSVSTCSSAASRPTAWPRRRPADGDSVAEATVDDVDPPATGGSRIEAVAALLTIGEFSRATHLSIKALRHYDDVGLLRPSEVDRDTGYRLYSTAQVPTAQLIRRFRALEMP